VWTEKPAAAPEAKPDDKAKQEKDAKPKPRGTIVKVGTADFNP
jgi:hypothetical protein